jgi:hypothetical protein
MTHNQGDVSLLLAYFREWIDLNRQYQASTDGAADDVLRTRRDSVEMQIHHTPASGARKLAIKGLGKILRSHHPGAAPEARRSYAAPARAPGG